MQLLESKYRMLLWTIALAVFEDIPSIVINLFILAAFQSDTSAASAGHSSFGVLLSLCVNIGGLGFKLRGVDTLATTMQVCACVCVCVCVCLWGV